MRAHGARSMLRPGLTAVLALAAAIPAAAAAPAEKQLSSRRFHEAIAHCRSGDEALRHGELSRASEQFEKALAIVPDFPEAYMGLGHIALVRRDYAAALGAYTRARDAYGRIGQQLYDHRLQRKGQSGLEIQSRRDDIMNLTKILQGTYITEYLKICGRPDEELDRWGVVVAADKLCDGVAEERERLLELIQRWL